MDVVPLYQLGGFRAHTSVMIPRDLAALVCPKGGIELILGVLPSGATYLLLEEGPFLRLFRRSRDRPWSSSDFRSLSPIYFDSREALEKKLEQYVHNKKNKKGQPRDRSKANTAYTLEECVQSLTSNGELRAEFELHRVFYRLCCSQLPRQCVYNFPYSVTSRVQTSKLVAFTFTLWKGDNHRRVEERRRSPTILDIGWTEFESPDAYKELRVKSCIHWRISENRMLSNGKPGTSEFKHGTSETTGQKDVTMRLQSLLSAVTPNVMLLLRDEQEACDVLTSLGIDITPWQTGLYPIFDRSRSSSASNSRRRSKSPARNVSRDPRQRPRSPEPPSVRPTYVDLQRLFRTLKQAFQSTIHDAARDFRLNTEVGWCAGNESVLLGEIWQAMASGNAIDDQRLARWSTTAQPLSPLRYPEDDVEDVKSFTSAKVEAEAAPADDESDSDFDPNNVEPTGEGGTFIEGVQPPATEGGSVAKDPYEELDDDDY